jgi:DNA-binding NarL/FixJ family response regulator
MSRVLIIGDRAEVSHKIGEALFAANFPMEYAAGCADALKRLRSTSFGVVITDPDSALDEDLALLEQMRAIRPGVKCIVLARNSTADKVIAAMRARVFACFTPPFETSEIARLACSAASDSAWREDIHVLSARPGWVSLRVNCRIITAERLMTFAKELSLQLPDETRQGMMLALREILMNAIEHGAAFNPDQVVEVTGIANPSDDPTAHIVLREEEGMRPGGYGMLLAAGTVDELIYSEIGNEVVLIKYLDPASDTNTD